MPRHLHSYALADCVNDKVLCDRGLHLGFVITSAELGCLAQTSANLSAEQRAIFYLKEI